MASERTRRVQALETRMQMGARAAGGTQDVRERVREPFALEAIESDNESVREERNEIGRGS